MSDFDRASTFRNKSGLRDRLLSPIAVLAMAGGLARSRIFGCAACATLAWLNPDVWYFWITVAGVALLVAAVTRDW